MDQNLYQFTPFTDFVQSRYTHLDRHDLSTFKQPLFLKFAKFISHTINPQLKIVSLREKEFLFFFAG